jgi:uncharacterized membrane protein SpoIIM required for sporulation
MRTSEIKELFTIILAAALGIAFGYGVGKSQVKDENMDAARTKHKTELCVECHIDWKTGE